MPWWTWICLGVWLALVLPTLLYAVVAVIRFFMALGRLGDAAGAAGEQLSAGMESVSASGERVTTGTERLQESVAALRDSKERVAVLLWALQDVRKLLRAARSFASPVK